jgi:mRNA-degrading endonuclease toxin of MazEF toxin-antitoxin module
VILRGCLHWAELDERRPVLVLSPDYRNARAPDVIVVPLSPVLRPSPTHVALREKEAGSPWPGVLHCEQICTVLVGVLEESALGSKLSPEKMHEVECAIMRALGIAVGA